jgi:hypothetical protein
MTLTKAIKIIKKHQKWRLGTEHTRPVKEKKLTEAINTILYGLGLTQKYIKTCKIGLWHEYTEL